MQIIINQLIQFCDGMILFGYYFNDSKSIIWYITFLRTENIPGIQPQWTWMDISLFDYYLTINNYKNLIGWCSDLIIWLLFDNHYSNYLKLHYFTPSSHSIWFLFDSDSF